MLKRFIVASLIFASSILTTACRTEKTEGVLVGMFDGEEPMISTIVTPSSDSGKYTMHFELRRKDNVCLLQGEIDDENIPLFGFCEGLKGSGSIVCDDGRIERLHWSLTSCHGGSGHSINTSAENFFFAFDQNEEKAREELTKSQRDGQKPANPIPTHPLLQ